MMIQRNVLIFILLLPSSFSIPIPNKQIGIIFLSVQKIILFFNALYALFLSLLLFSFILGFFQLIFKDFSFHLFSKENLVKKL